jgi:sugar diacid utilization regulator
VQSLGLPNSTEPAHLPGNDELGMMPRYCVPLIYQDLKLGYLWLIEGDAALSAEDEAEAVTAAEQIALAMYRERLICELERGKERELLRDLLADDARLREAAATALVNDELLANGPVSVLVLTVIPAASATVDHDQIRDATEIALANVRRTLPLRHALHLVRPDHGLLLVVADNLAELGGKLVHEFSKHIGAASAQVRAVVGIGERQPRAVAALSSYTQAGQAAHVAEILPAMGPVARWSELGIYRTLAQLPPEELAADALHPGLVRLLTDEGGDVLLHTLECFLDLAGDVKATSQELGIHRTSLYYRISRIEDLAGVDLGRGGDRLALHLGLKIARLAGLRGTSGAFGRVASPRPVATVQAR